MADAGREPGGPDDSPEDYLLRYLCDPGSEDQDGRLAITVRDTCDSIHEGHEHVEHRIDRLSESSIDHPLVNAVIALYIWHQSKNEDRFQRGAATALTEFEEAFDALSGAGNDKTALVCLLERAKLENSLSDYTPEGTLKKGIGFVEDDPYSLLQSDGEADEVIYRDLLELIDLVIDSDPVDRELLERALSICSRRAEMARKGLDHTEKDYLERLIQLAEILDRDADRISAESRLIESFEVWAEANEQYLSKAGILRQGLAKCRDFMEREQRENWRLRIQEYNRRGKPEPRELGEFRISLEPFVEQFRSNAEDTSTDIAIAAMACWNALLPDYAGATSQESSSPITEIFSEEIIDSDNLPVAINPPALDFGEDQDRLPMTHRVMLSTYEAVIADILNILINSGDIKEGDLFCLLNRFRVLNKKENTDDFAFLTDAVIHFFDGEYAAAIHICMGRLEGVIRRSLESKETSTSRMKADNSLQSKTLKDLTNLIAEEDEQFGNYLRYQYADPVGNNERNKVAHSKLKYRNADFQGAAVLLFDIIRILIRIEQRFPHSE